MKILLINHYAGSDQMGMEYRPFYLAHEWVADGHDVTIIGADFSHLRGRQPAVKADLETTTEGHVRFRWLRTRRYDGNDVGRVVNMLEFVAKLFVYGRRIAEQEKPDLVICSSTYPLDIYPGSRIARKAGARLVFEVHDLWPLTPILLGRLAPSHPFIRLLQHAEDWAYRHVDTVVSILPDAKDYMVEHGLAPGKFVHIPNGIPTFRSLPDHEDLPAGIQSLITSERSRDRFLVGFAGGINLNMALDTVLDAAGLLADANVTFFIAGDGAGTSRLRERITQCHLDNVHLVGRIAKLAVPAFLCRMDALVIPWHRNPLYRYGVSPNKLFDYMLAAKPIVQGSDASNDLVTEAQCGFTIEPENPVALADAVRRLLALPPEMRHELGENGRRYVLANNDCRILARNFLESAVPMGSRSSATRSTSPQYGRIVTDR